MENIRTTDQPQVVNYVRHLRQDRFRDACHALLDELNPIITDPQKSASSRREEVESHVSSFKWEFTQSIFSRLKITGQVRPRDAGELAWRDQLSHLNIVGGMPVKGSKEYYDQAAAQRIILRAPRRASEILSGLQHFSGAAKMNEEKADLMAWPSFCCLGLATVCFVWRRELALGNPQAVFLSVSVLLAGLYFLALSQNLRPHVALNPGIPHSECELNFELLSYDSLVELYLEGPNDGGM